MPVKEAARPVRKAMAVAKQAVKAVKRLKALEPRNKLKLGKPVTKANRRPVRGKYPPEPARVAEAVHAAGCGRLGYELLRADGTGGRCCR